MKGSDSIEFYVDGSCSGNGTENSIGGFGVVGVENDEVIFTYSKINQPTTNNREELRAILYVLIHYGHLNPIVYSDSAYCVNSLTTWIYGWERKGWLKSDNKPPENLDLIQAYWELLQKGYSIQLRKIKGHVGHIYNEMADKLATRR